MLLSDFYCPTYIICEGVCEVAYLRNLSQLLVTAPDRRDPFKPMIAGGGDYSRVKKVFDRLRRDDRHFKDHPQDIQIWVDWDIYLRNEGDTLTSYENRDSDVQKFLFSYMNYEDFLALHMPDDVLWKWIDICRRHGHFETPMTAATYVPLFRALVGDYEKPFLPFVLNRESFERLLKNCVDPNIPLKSDLAVYLRKAMEEGRLEYR